MEENLEELLLKQQGVSAIIQMQMLQRKLKVSQYK